MLATLSYMHVSALSLHGVIGKGFQSTTFSRRSSFFVKAVQGCLTLTDICRPDMQAKNESHVHNDSDSDSDNEPLPVSINARRLKEWPKDMPNFVRFAHWSIGVGDQYYELLANKGVHALVSGRTELKVTDAPLHPFLLREYRTLPEVSRTTMSQEEVREKGALIY